MFRMLSTATAALILCIAPAIPALAEMTAAEKKDVEQVVRDYIIANPEIVQEALIALEDKRKLAEKAKQTEAITTLSDAIFRSEHQAVMGNPEGTITIVEFFDYNCGFCKRALNDMEALKDTNPDLRIVMKEFPILSQGSLEAARVSVAVSKLAPEAYADFHREVLVRSGTANHAKAMAIVKDLGLDEKAIEAAAGKEDVLENFAEVRMLADSLGVTGTPSFVIGKEAVFGAVGYDALQEKVIEARNCATAVC